MVDRYHTEGYLVLPNFLDSAEVAEIETVYDKFMQQEIKVPGKDFCDMSAGYDKRPEDFSIINCMLPRVYHPPLQGNIYEVRAADVARQLFDDVEMRLDYDQLLNKRPSKTDAVFAWHQDLAYWPPTRDTRTVTFSLAVDATTRENGCIRFVPGSHKEPELRDHKPLGRDRDEAHAIACQVDERSDDNPLGKDDVVYATVNSGDVTIHNERIVHGSGGNFSTGTRRTYVVAFRTEDTVAQERAAGFTHSHNDDVNWDTFNRWQEQ